MSITNYPDADFTPDIPNSGANTGKQSYNPTGSFRFWAQKVLPTVYDDSLSYYEILTKVVNYLNAVIQNVDSLNDSVDNTNSSFDTLQDYVNGTKDTIVSAYNELQSYVNTYFDSLDIQEEINTKLDAMASDGSLSSIISPFIPSLVSDWLSQNITPTSPAIDASLSVSGAGADAKVTGEFVRTNSAELADIRVGADGTVYDNAGDAVRGQVSDLKSALNDIYKIVSVSADANTWIGNLNITAGKTFKVVNNSSERVVCGFYASDKSTSLQTAAEIVRYTTGYITADNDTAYLLVYSPSGATGAITIEDCSPAIPTLERSLNSVIAISVTGTATHWLNLPLVAGKTYKIINGSNSYISTDAYASNKSTKVETIGQITSGETRTFTPENNAYYLLIYCPASASTGEIIVYEDNTYGAEIEKLKLDVNNIVTVGTEGDYQTVKEGIEVAIAQNKELLILPGTYDLVSEGISGKGYWCPKKIYGYGATLVCHLSSEDWTLSPLNVFPTRGTEIYGLTIDATNCRYCVHDDMGTESVNPYYHNIYKDCHFIHNSDVSSTLLAPQCIGGGLGDGGYIEITNCVFEAKIRDVSYHTLSTVSQRLQTGKCEVIVSGCYFSHMPTVAPIGSGTEVLNTMYVSNCSLGEAVTAGVQSNIQLIAWNNEVRS